MLGFALKRLGLAVLVGEGARAEDIENIRRIYGLDRPLVVQYLDWIGKMAHGDFGQSLYFKTDVLALVRDKLPTTALLAMFSLLFALAISIPLGIVAAVYPNSWIDRACLALAVLGH